MAGDGEDTQAVQKRESQRIRIPLLTKEIADDIVAHLELVDKFFSEVDSPDEGAIKSFYDTMEQWLLSVSEKYAELNDLTSNTIGETLENMYLAFKSQIREKREKLQANLQEIELKMQLEEEEEVLKKAAEAYSEQQAKFKALMERMKLHKDIPITISRPVTPQSQPQSQALLPSTTPPDRTAIANQPQNQSIDAVTELAKSLITTMKSSKRAMPEPAIYDGDPIAFQDWEMDFEAFVESEGLTGVEPLRFLKRFLKGKAKDAVSGHFITNTAQAYTEARKELKKRFGSQHNVNRALRVKLDSWNKIAPQDAAALRRYADFLLHVKSAMKNIPELQSLSHSQENEKLATKLPDWLIRLWARKIKDKRNTDQVYPTFAEFSDFVVDHAEVADEPLMRLSSNSRKERKVKNPPMTESVKAFTTTTSKNESCLYCKNTHATTECSSLSKLEDDKKEAFVKENRLCWGCLTAGHRSTNCPERATCQKCKRRHPTSLHKDNYIPRTRSRNTDQTPANQGKADQGKENGAPDKVQTSSKNVSVKSTVTKETVLSMVVPIYVSNNDNPTNETLVYAMLDTQSDSSYVTSDTARAIDPKFTKEVITMDTLQGEETVTIKRFKDLRIRGLDQDESTKVNAYEWDRLTCAREQIPNAMNVSQYPHLISVAHKLPPLLDIPVGMLIGANCSEAFIPLEAVVGDMRQPFAQRTMLGWTVFGSGHHVEKQRRTRVHATCVSCVEQDAQVEMSQEDFRFLDMMDKGLHTNSSGYFEGPLPFRERPLLPNNRIQAEKRLKGLRKKMDTSDVFKEEYYAFMNDLLARGHAEPITEKSIKGEVWYIPHFAVSHPQKKKLRVVFDCSAEFRDESLNGHLLQGPDLTNSMLGILLRFRRETVALACDIEKMFYNFYVDPQDRDFLRFLWFDEDDTIKEYRMTVHLFGASSSPAVATYCLQRLAKDHGASSETAAKFVQNDFYVDDGITSVATVSDANQLITDARTLCIKGKLRLHKFVSNKKEVLECIPDTERSVKDIDLLHGSLPTQRTLGLEWCIENDTLKYSSNVAEKAPTRRGILSTISQLYDPLGFLAPFTLNGKTILQRVNKEQDGWDEMISTENQILWETWLKDLEALKDIQVPRCVKPGDFGNIKYTELHNFCDASLEGIGACSYLRFINEEDKVHTCLVLAKSRVVPSKGTFTVPRLELQGAVMATQLSGILHKELDMTIDAEHFWSDSEIVLAYLANEHKRFHIYVANRVRHIRMATDIHQWHHISGEDNPADIASRGMSCRKLNSSMWFSGPKFLQQQSVEKVYHLPITKTLDDKDPEVKRVKATIRIQRQPSPLSKLMAHFSSKNRLTRVVGYLKKMAQNKSWRLHPLDSEDLNNANKLLIRVSQEEHFLSELKALSSGGSVSTNSSLKQLNTFVDKEGILRVGGRMSNSSTLTYSEKHPIIIPKDCNYGRIIAHDIHSKTHHAGKAYTLTAIRQAGLWIVGASRLVKELVKRCVTCRILRGKVSSQLMGELPAERVGHYPPFTHSGMDCFGPFEVKERRTELKRYGLVFTCLYSRAVHIEMLDDMSTDAFLNALRCFMSVRGHIKTLYSDHGTNFTGGRNELAKQFASMLDGDAKDFLANQQICFKMTTPTASHQGGVWERQIRTIRSILTEIFLKHKGRFDSTMLRTAFAEVSSIVNSRPLSIVDVNDPDEMPITASSLLTGKTDLTPPPPGNFSTETYSKARWKQVQCLAEAFWQKWKTSYLDEASKRQRWQDTQSNLKVRDVVLILDQDMPRNHWRKAMVEEVHPGQDGKVRSVTLRIGTPLLSSDGRPMEKMTVLKRPIQKLIKLT